MALSPRARLLLARRFYVSPLGEDPEMQFTWVDDVASAFAAAVFARDATGPFNVGAPGTVRASEVARVLEARSLRMPYGLRKAVTAAGTRLRVPGARHPGLADTARYPIVVSAERAERELGWRAEHESVDALRVYAARTRDAA
jgi:nucleoside-diphosphate-sugar epimerase